MTHLVTVVYADGVERTMPVGDEETLLEAAEEQGIPIVSACQSGVCGTCVALCRAGNCQMAPAPGLGQSDREAGKVLTCQSRAGSDCVIELDYPFDANAARIVMGEAVVARVERLSADTALLALDVSGLPADLGFRPGQFAQLQPPGSGAWRSYSFVHAPRPGREVEFLVRLLPQGVMSDYLRHKAQPGDRMAIRGPKGGFYLRHVTRPVILMAGGTGLSAILSIAEQLLRLEHARPVHLNYGVTQEGDLVLLERIKALQEKHANFTWDAIVSVPSGSWTGKAGQVADLLQKNDLHGGNIDVYLCGPSAMVDAARQELRRRGFGNAALFYEKFVPSGARQDRQSIDADRLVFDVAQLRQEGRRTAIVIGGSMAGMATAKVLTETFDKVIVLEKDPDHRRMEGRPGAAQGWHLHHLLIAGQRQLESIFPGIIDDMVQAGAFKVDMGQEYRLMLAGSWKKVIQSGVEIVCAARPLLEWCVRRRLDTEPGIEYRYESDVRDLIMDQDSGAIVGVAVDHAGVAEIIAGEFFVDAAGKNTPVPALLGKRGVEMPRIEEDHINCFYSTMQHRVPPKRAWRDKVMVICYAHRPQQEHYAAQFFLDSTRTVLSTSLVGYNSHTAPRNAEEFRKFARRMPSQAIGDELDGLEPCSPVYNFRYPTMQRYHYEEMKNLPENLVAVGDSYASADPVSGAGMTKALLELNELRTLLRQKPRRDQAFVRRYYRKVAKLADLVWFVIREQNLRYPWIKDVKKKRPFYFRLHNWYVDRVFEAMHDAPDLYRLYLMTTHFVAPPWVLMHPLVVVRVLGKWLLTKMRFQKTLIEQNFDHGQSRESKAGRS